jgi:hypothetical protein
VIRRSLTLTTLAIGLVLAFGEALAAARGRQQPPPVPATAVAEPTAPTARATPVDLASVFGELPSSGTTPPLVPNPSAPLAQAAPSTTTSASGATTTTVPTSGGEQGSNQTWAFVALGAMLVAVAGLVARSARRPSR